MAIIKKSEFKQMTEPNIKERLNELKKELMKYNAQISTGKVTENPGRVRLIKKTIARLNTLLNIKRNQKIETKEVAKK